MNAIRFNVREHWPMYAFATIFGPLSAVVVGGGSLVYYALEGRKNDVGPDALGLAAYSALVLAVSVAVLWTQI